MMRTAVRALIASTAMTLAAAPDCLQGAVAEHSASRAQTHAVAMTGKQHAAQFAFERGHLPADCRLSLIEHGGGAAERAELGDTNEGM